MAETGFETKLYNLAGIFSLSTGDGQSYDMKVPGTLDESNIGHGDAPEEASAPLKGPENVKDPFDRMLSDEGLLYEELPEEAEERVIMTRYTRKYAYEGPVRISRQVSYQESMNKRLFLEVERARVLRLFIDGREIPHFTAPTLVTPHIFEVTGYLNGTHLITFVSDNSYPGLPHDDIVRSNMASEETGTNWNGLLGYVRLREENEAFIEQVSLRTEGNRLNLHLEISARYPCELLLRLSSPVFTREYVTKLTIRSGASGFVFDGLVLREDAPRWNVGDGKMNLLKIELSTGETRWCAFGIRDFTIREDRKFEMNGQALYLRGETDASVHPDTAYCPMEKAAWTKIYTQYMKYGANFVRFSSHCPPEAAFDAADELGMPILVELSCHQMDDAYKTREAQAYYELELTRILKTYGNHPSFVMLSFGGGRKYPARGPEFLNGLLARARALDPKRFYTLGENVLSASADFILVTGTGDLPEEVSKPVLLSGVGQYEMLSDFTEIDLFSGVLLPDNLIRMRENVEKEGLKAVWSKYVEASGEAALKRYRDEIERIYLDPRISGILLFGLKDYPGEGAAPHGMMNSYLVQKPYAFATPKRFSAFYAPVVVMADLSSRNLAPDETLYLTAYVLNFGTEELRYPLKVSLKSGGGKVEHLFLPNTVKPGEIRKFGGLSLAIGEDLAIEKTAAEVTVVLRFGAYESAYQVRVYPPTIPVCPEKVLETEELTDAAIRFLQDGGNVFITPRVPSGRGRGSRYIENSHPVFRCFSGERYENEAWEDIPGSAFFTLPRRMKTIVSRLKQPVDLKPEAQLFEARVLNGSVMVSSLGLKERITQAEAATLLSGIYDYMGSYEFSPSEELRVQELRDVLSSLKIED